jgi:hypothetical protein
MRKKEVTTPGASAQRINSEEKLRQTTPVPSARYETVVLGRCMPVHYKRKSFAASLFYVYGVILNLSICTPEEE